RIPESAWRAVAGRISPLKTIDALKNPSPGWFGVEDARGGRDAVLLSSLEDAVKETRERLGDDPSKWRWGKLHVAPFTHALSTDAERLALFNLPSVERSGDGNTVNSTGGPELPQTPRAPFPRNLRPNGRGRAVAPD